MNDYLSKPIQGELLYQSIEAMLNKGAENPTAPQTPVAAEAPAAQVDATTAINQSIMSNLREQLGDEKVREILNAFFIDAAERFEDAQAALKAQRFDTAMEQVHSIKGSSASLGLVRVASSSLAIENCTADDDAGSGDAVERLEQAMSTLEKSLEEAQLWFDKREG